MISHLLAGFVFGATCIAAAIVALTNLEAPNARSLALSPGPILVVGCTISGVLVLSHWYHPW